MFMSLLLAGAVAHGAQELTALSAKAGGLETGMTRNQVIARLGPPTWAVLPSDTGDFKIPDSSISLMLAWKNAPCAPVVVDFDHSGKVIGWDEGRAVCGKDVELLRLELPGSRSCSQADRSRACGNQ
ncbi:MAG: hypothetical protein J0H86_15665 [Xanthomonadaceae bacterium]|nr:hypothetical protein [Xanthomonadaceae bacterium]